MLPACTISKDVLMLFITKILLAVVITSAGVTGYILQRESSDRVRSASDITNDESAYEKADLGDIMGQLQHAPTVNITPGPTDPPTPTPLESKEDTSIPGQREAAFGVRITQAPAQATAGSPFVIRWEVVSATGTRVDQTRIVVKQDQKTSSGGSSSSITSNSRQSFQSFIAPKEFESSFTFSGTVRSVEVVVMATIGQREVIDTRTIHIR